MDIQELAKRLTTEMHYAPYQKTAQMCISELLNIGIEYFFKGPIELKPNGEENPEKKKNPKLQGIDQSINQMLETASMLSNQIKSFRRSYKEIFNRMSFDVDAHFGILDYLDPLGEPIEDRPLLNHDFADKWVEARVPFWLDTDSAILNRTSSDESKKEYGINYDQVELLDRFIQWLEASRLDLHDLRMARAKRGLNVLFLPEDHDEKLVQQVAEAVFQHGGKKSHVLPLAQTIALWADPTKPVGDQWGRGILERLKLAWP